jgi:hypothetical protein
MKKIITTFLLLAFLTSAGTASTPEESPDASIITSDIPENEKTLTMQIQTTDQNEDLEKMVQKAESEHNFKNFGCCSCGYCSRNLDAY